MYDKNAMDNVNLWLEENKKKNDDKIKNNEIECESLDDDWDSLPPIEQYARRMREVNSISSAKTTVIPHVSESCINLDRPIHEHKHSNRRRSYHNKQVKDNTAQNVITEQEDEKPINPKVFVLAAIVFIIIKSLSMLHIL